MTGDGMTNGVHPAVSDAVLARLGAETGAARGLPNEAFTSPEFHALEKRHLFPRTWVFAAALSDIPRPGDALPVEVAGRSLLVLRDRTGEVRVFFNVCPHRGARLLAEPTENAVVLTCPYHAWSFGLDGRLKGRPHYHGPTRPARGEGEAADRVCLFPVRSAVWHDWVFVNLDARAAPFEDYMAPVLSRYQSWNFSAFARAHHQSYPFACNWKLAIENFCDNYHVFKVHPALHDMQATHDRFGMEPDGCHMFNWFTMDAEGRGLSVDPGGPVLPEVPGLPSELRRNSPFSSIFPNATLAVFPSNLEFFVFEPLGAERCTMHVWFYFVGEAAASEEHRAAREKVVEEWSGLNAEDAGICRRLQQGRACDAYDGGRLAPYWDAGTLHFHTQIAHAIRGMGLHARP